MKRYLFAAHLALVVILSPVTAFALNLTWTGAGSSGQDPLGHDWTVNESGWGIPGPGEGNIPWLGESWISDFHITFFDLPEDVTIGNGIFRIDPFEVGPDDWQTTIMDDTVWFVVNDVNQILDPGQNFFVNVFFSQGIQEVTFIAEYTMTVPEPSTIALTAIALLGLLAHRRRRRA